MKRRAIVVAVVFALNLALLGGVCAGEGIARGIAPLVDIDPEGGADSYAGKGDNPASRYYVNMDFYNAKSDGMLAIIPHYRTYQQTAEWSCGNAVALAALHHFGISKYSEWDIAVTMGSHADGNTPGALPGTASKFGDYGTDVAQMTRFFRRVDGVEVLETSYRAVYTPSDLLTVGDGVPESMAGNLPPTFSEKSLYTSENDDDSEAWVADAKDSYFVRWLTGHIERGNVVMVEWADWDGHWTAIVGYDNNGTPGIGDDILIFADPYDTSDHMQDGYAVFPLERWFRNWNDRTVARKPYQLQPYLVLGRAHLPNESD
ncbi:hypothetical protein LJC31_00535 [Synergistaceae bacterium OttesenSCG-928-I11]|nr:hypothetical protein [Synergistaceae bacterium OttesenSCG-928-I11]